MLANTTKDGIPQFGKLIENVIYRPSVYAVIIRDEKILVAEVNGIRHLPGGGKEEGLSDENQLLVEIEEETGYKAEVLDYIGKANQYTTHRKLGPVNKMGDFYTARVISNDGQYTDQDHKPMWLDVNDYLEGDGLDSHKWAVKKALSLTKNFS